MSMLASVEDSEKDWPGVMVIYGRHGLGKTTLACSFPNPILFNTEKSTPKGVNVPSIRASDMSGRQMLIDLIAELMNEPHDYKTLVIDTLDTFEGMMEESICDAMGWSNISVPDYGVGYTEASNAFGYIMQGLHKLRDKRSMHIVILAHVEVGRFDDPRMGSYSTYDIAVRKRVRKVCSDLCDAIFFMSQDPALEQKKGESAKANASQNVYLFTQPNPAFNAKNPWGMPKKLLIPADDPFSALAEHIPGLGQSVSATTKEAA